MILSDKIAAVCEQAIKNRVFPGCSVAYVTGGSPVTQAFGRLTYDMAAPPVRDDTLYDVASITKSVPTSSLLLKLIESGRIGLDDQVIRYIPELQNDHREHILVRHLLTYTVVFDLGAGAAGLARSHPNGVIAELLRTPVVSAPGTSYRYTNGPAILMGVLIERVSGLRIDELAKSELFEPLQMNRSTFSPNVFGLQNVAPSEIGEGGEVRGRVHDESSWAISKLGRHSGAAGLFSTSSDLIRYCQMLLGRGSLDGVRIFEPDTVTMMHTNQIPGLPEQAGMGWELLRKELRGNSASDQTFGKTGFTGCVMIIDPQNAAALVHLSNRAYPKRPADNSAINALRRELAELVFSS